jgi:hypothetical protein
MFYLSRAILGITTFFALSFASLATQDKPYQEGDVDAFLTTARSNGRPSIVLFNFDEKSG